MTDHIDAERACHVYLAVMDCIKLRVSALRQLNNVMRRAQEAGTPEPLPGPIVVEIFYQQLRLICEGIAIGCLVAHHDIEITQTNELRGDWSADRLIRRLEKLHADFFPEPGRQILGPNGELIEFEPFKDGFLTKKELLQLYFECHEMVHHASLKNILRNNPKELSAEKALGWLKRIPPLLNCHRIKLVDGKEMWAVMHEMNTGVPTVRLVKPRLTPES